MSAPAAWMDRAACAGVDDRVFVPSTAGTRREPRVPSRRALAFCRTCPVAGDCLEWALSWPGTVGVYGGTSTAQRRQLKRPRARRACPVCRSADSVIPLGDAQACTWCAVSWRAA